MENLGREKEGKRKGVEGVVAPWCNSLTLQPEQSGGVGSIASRTSPLERHDKSRQEIANSVRFALFLRSQCLALKYTTSPSPSRFLLYFFFLLSYFFGL